MEGVEIRQAVLTDKEAVLAIQKNLFDGTDYMAALYDYFISSPWSSPYVLVYKNEIVSFATAFVVDDGETVISRCGRTKDKCAGKGFYKMLSQHCLETSGVRVLAFTCSSVNKAIYTDSFQKENILILSKPYRRFDVDAKSLPVIPEDLDTSIAELTQSQLERYMASDAQQKYLFPDGRIIINWVPFRLLPSNIPLLWAEGETSLRLSDVRQENNGVIAGLLSIATTFYGTTGMFTVHVDVYGTDKRSVKGHLETHMDFAHKQGDGRIALFVCCDSSLTSFVMETCGEYELEEPVWNWNVQSLFEKQSNV